MEGIALIGLNWSGPRLSAFAFDEAGCLLGQTVMHDVRRPEASEFIARSRLLLDQWLGDRGDVPVLACGDIAMLLPAGQGIALPAECSRLGGHIQQVGGIHLVPWLERRAPADLSCGAETVLMGLDEDHASVCIAAAHTHHVRLEHGRVTGLSTRITSELQGLLLSAGSLAQPGGPSQVFDRAVFREWVETGLDAQARVCAFAVQASILSGQLDPSFRSAALAGLLVGQDVGGHYQPGDEVLLVADGGLTEAYGLAFDALGVDVIETSYSEALQEGLLELADLAGLLGEDGPRP